MKELGLTPKEAAKMNTDEKTASATEQLAAVAAEAVLGGGEDGDEPSFDPDDEIFDDDG